MEEKPQKPRKFQFSLRALLIVTTVCAVGFGLFAWRLHKARQQRAVVAALHVRGYSLVHRLDYDYQLGDRTLPPAWLVNAMGVDYFASVQRLDLRETKVNDADLDVLKALTGLRTLDLSHTKVTDAGVERLQRSLPNCKIHRRP